MPEMAGVFGEDMTNSDKIKTACWFRCICRQITARNWPADEREHIEDKVSGFLKTAVRLEREAFEPDCGVGMP